MGAAVSILWMPKLEPHSVQYYPAGAQWFEMTEHPNILIAAAIYQWCHRALRERPLKQSTRGVGRGACGTSEVNSLGVKLSGRPGGWRRLHEAARMPSRVLARLLLTAPW